MSKKYQRTCKHCGDPYETNVAKKVFCLRACSLAWYSSNNGALSHKRDIPLPSPTVGALNEYRVIVDLLGKGYSVYRSVSPSAKCDLVAFPYLDDKTAPLRIEVKTSYRRINASGGKVYHASFSPGQEAFFDTLAMVLPDIIVYEPPLPPPAEP